MDCEITYGGGAWFLKQKVDLTRGTAFESCEGDWTCDQRFNFSIRISIQKIAQYHQATLPLFRSCTAAMYCQALGPEC